MFVYNKEPSRLHMRTLANWEGRVCFGFDFVVRGFFPFSHPLDFGYVKLSGWRRGNVSLTSSYATAFSA